MDKGKRETVVRLSREIQTTDAKGGTQVKIKSNRKSKRYDKKKTKKVRTVQVLTPEQEMRIAQVENDRDRGMLVLLLHTGLRVSELHNLNYRDVFEPGLKTVRDCIIVVGKGNKEREIPLNKDARRAVRLINGYNRRVLRLRQLTGRNPLLITRIGTRMSVNMVERITKNETGVTPHVLRHSALTRMKNEGVRLEVLQTLAGHSSINTTAKYYLNITSEEMREAVKKIESPDEPRLKIVKLTG